MATVVLSTDCSYFIPPFVELTTSDVNRIGRLLAESGVTYPFGMYRCFLKECWYAFGPLNSPVSSGQAFVQPRGCLCSVCAIVFCHCDDDVFATVCKPSVAHYSGPSVPLQADREEVGTVQ